MSGKAEGMLHVIPKGSVPFATLHIDHYGPIDKKCLVKQHILVVIDSFTKFTRLFTVKTTASKEVIHHLKEYFNSYSRPSAIVSDRGSSFTSEEFQEFLRENDIRHVQIATGSPKANGQVERINRIIGPMLAKLSEKSSGRHWYKVIEDVEYALNNTVSKSTGETPSKLLFGVNQRMLKLDPVRNYVEQQGERVERDLEKMRAIAAQKIKKSQAYNERYFYKGRKEPIKYEKDDYVMVRNFESTPGVSKKLIP